MVHTIVTGGQALVDTLHGAAQLVKQLEVARFIVWLNPFWGPVALDGKTFEQMKVYQDIKKRIETVVNLPAFTDELFPQDIASMLNSRLTFKERVSQKELLEQNAAQQQKLLSEFQAALGRNQTAWSEQAKALAQQSLTAGLQAAQNSTALLLEEAARVNAAALRKAFEEGASRIEHLLAVGRRIAWLSLSASIVALTAAVCAIFVHVIH